MLEALEVETATLIRPGHGHHAQAALGAITLPARVPRSPFEQ